MFTGIELMKKSIFLGLFVAVVGNSAFSSAQQLELDVNGLNGLPVEAGSHFMSGEAVSVSVNYSKPGPQGYGFGPSVLKPLEKSAASDDVKAQLEGLMEFAYKLMPSDVIRADRGDSKYHLQIDVAAEDYSQEGQAVPHKIRFALAYTKSSHGRDIVRGVYELPAEQNFASASVVKNMIEVLAGVRTDWPGSTAIATN